jgi:hypothetical protein
VAIGDALNVIFQALCFVLISHQHSPGNVELVVVCGNNPARPIFSAHQRKPGSHSGWLYQQLPSNIANVPVDKKMGKINLEAVLYRGIFERIISNAHGPPRSWTFEDEAGKEHSNGDACVSRPATRTLPTAIGVLIPSVQRFSFQF